MWLKTAQSEICIVSCVNLYIHPPVANLESDLIRQPQLANFEDFPDKGLGNVGDYKP